MTFQSITDLPRPLRDELPEQAQELYRAAYNQAWEANHVGDATDESDLADRAGKAAWLKVRQEFVQDENGRWRRHPVGDDVDEDDIRDTG